MPPVAIAEGALHPSKRNEYIYIYIYITGQQQLSQADKRTTYGRQVSEPQRCRCRRGRSTESRP